MSGRFQSGESTPTRPKSLSPKRRPLHQRSDSEINERSTPVRPQQPVRDALGRNDQENAPSAATPSYRLPKIYTTSPFPLFESQILRPFPDAAPQASAHAGSVAVGHTTFTPTQTPAVTHNRHATVTTPVIIDHGTLSSPRSHDSILHDDSIRSSNPSTSLLPELSFDEAGLTTPASTIRLVDDTPSTGSRHGAMTNFSVPVSARSRHSFYDDNYSPSISDLPSLPREDRFNPAAESPTPATRQYRPTIRTIADLQSEATQTPGSIRSANSSGTQVHRQARAADDLLPGGSYLHYADRRIRRSSSDPEILASSPIVQRLGDSISPSPNFRQLGNSPDSSPNFRRLGDSPVSPPRRRGRISERSSPNFGSPGSQRSDFSNDRFPALTRYVEATRDRTRSPTSPNRADLLTSPRRRFRPVHQRWSSMESDFRHRSSEVGSVMGAVLEEPSIFETIESALSVSIASAHPSIRLVEAGENSPAQSSFVDEPQPRQTPRARFYEVRDATEEPEITTNSPVWVSYSSPATHLPYIPDSAESLPTPEVSRANLTQLSESASTSDSQAGQTPTSPNPKDIIYPANSSHQDVRVPGMRRRSTMRQTSSPFFVPGSQRGHMRQSTVSHSPAQSPANSMSEFDFGLGPAEREPAIAATSAFQPSPDPSNLSPMIQSTAATPSPRFGRNGNSEWPWPRLPEQPPARSPMRPRIPFPANPDSSTGDTPKSIHIPRNRRNNPGITIKVSGHARNQTFGGEPSPSLNSSFSSRHSRSPTVPSIDYRDEEEPVSSVIRMPFTPPSHVARPGNPTPGVTPATTVRSPGGRTLQFEAMVDSSPDRYESPLPDIAPLRPPRPRTMSFLVPTSNSAGSPSLHESSSGAGPSGASRMHTVRALPQTQQARRDAQVRETGMVNNDWAPHLWHGAPHTLNRRSAFIAPSVNSSSAPFLRGYKSRRDLQVLLFLLGFLLPPCWLVASLLPLPAFGNVEGTGAFGGMGGGRAERLARGKSVIGIDGLGDRDLEKEVRWSADEVAGYESARWWRLVNRGLSLLGLGVCVVLIVIGVVTSQGKINGN